MNLQLEILGALCETAIFMINGIEADYRDFGTKGDESPSEGEEYGCGNMQFTAEPSSPEVLRKYKITEEEYAEICEKLTNGLSFGRCGWCV